MPITSPSLGQRNAHARARELSLPRHATSRMAPTAPSISSLLKYQAHDANRPSHGAFGESMRRQCGKSPLAHVRRVFAILCRNPTRNRPTPIVVTQTLSLADLRKNYALGSLSETDVAPSPFDQFRRWFEQALAAQLPEPNAMTLATVTPDGRPTLASYSSRARTKTDSRSSRITSRAKAANWRPRLTAACCSTGSNSSARCASRAVSRR